MKNKALFQNQIQKSVDVLQKGGLILYPTDTVWGIGCDATNPNAVRRVFELKKRSEAKSLIILADSLKMIQTYAMPLSLAASFALTQVGVSQTVILPYRDGLAAAVVSQEKTVAFRLAQHCFCQSLLSVFKKPIVSTSANISQKATALFKNDISPKITGEVDFIVSFLMEENSTHRPSRLMRVNPTGEVCFLRR